MSGQFYRISNERITSAGTKSKNNYFLNGLQNRQGKNQRRFFEKSIFTTTGAAASALGVISLASTSQAMAQNKHNTKTHRNEGQKTQTGTVQNDTQMKTVQVNSPDVTGSSSGIVGTIEAVAISILFGASFFYAWWIDHKSDVNRPENMIKFMKEAMKARVEQVPVAHIEKKLDIERELIPDLKNSEIVRLLKLVKETNVNEAILTEEDMKKFHDCENAGLVYSEKINWRQPQYTRLKITEKGNNVLDLLGEYLRNVEGSEDEKFIEFNNNFANVQKKIGQILLVKSKEIKIKQLQETCVFSFDTEEKFEKWATALPFIQIRALVNEFSYWVKTRDGNTFVQEVFENKLYVRTGLPFPPPENYERIVDGTNFSSWADGLSVGPASWQKGQRAKLALRNGECSTGYNEFGTRITYQNYEGTIFILSTQLSDENIMRNQRPTINPYIFQGDNRG